MPDKVLFLYTSVFPYEKGESFLEAEIPFLSKYFSEIIILPSVKNGKINDHLPGNVSVADFEDTTNSKAIFWSNVLLITYLLLFEFWFTKRKFVYLKRFRLTISELIVALKRGKKVLDLSKKFNGRVIHYSFWMNENVLMLSILKWRNLIPNYVFRVHGYDLYEERRKDGYIPFVRFSYKHSDCVYPISKLGEFYVRNRYKFKGNVKTFYLGTKDGGKNPYDPSTFNVVTCSRIVPLKRLIKLAESLCYFSSPVNWYHFGDGEKQETDKLMKVIANLPSSIVFKNAGFVSQSELFHFYQNNPVTCFVNVSETEGLPVSIMEAISFGIPVIGTDVGGVSEIVKAETGILLPIHFTVEELNLALLKIKQQVYNTLEFRAEVKNFWNSMFSAELNYEAFCQELDKIGK